MATNREVNSKKITLSTAFPELSNAPIVEVLAVGQSKNGKAIVPDGAYQELVERLVETDGYNGSLNSIQYVKFGGRRPKDSCLVLGLGKAPTLTEEKLRAAIGL